MKASDYRLITYRRQARSAISQSRGSSHQSELTIDICHLWWRPTATSSSSMMSGGNALLSNRLCSGRPTRVTVTSAHSTAQRPHRSPPYSAGLVGTNLTSPAFSAFIIIITIIVVIIISLRRHTITHMLLARPAATR